MPRKTPQRMRNEHAGPRWPPRLEEPGRTILKARLSVVVGALVALAIASTGGSAYASDAAASSPRDARPASVAVDRVDWAAGSVARWTGYRSNGGSERVRAVQGTLRRLEYRPGPVDGLFGPLTERAVLRFQRAEALPQDGIVGPRTLRRLRVRDAGERRTSPPAAGGQRAPGRRRVAPSPVERPAPSPLPANPQDRAAPSPVPAAPAAGGPGREVILLVGLLGLVVALLALVVFAAAVAARHGGTPDARPSAPALPAGPAGEAADAAVAESAGGRPGPRLGDFLCDAGALRRGDLLAALEEQRRSGGRLGEILTASGTVSVDALTQALARQLRIRRVDRDDEPVALLDADDARAWRAVAINGGGTADGAVAVALADPTDELLARLRERLGRPVEPRLGDDATLDDLLRRAYADADARDVTRMLREEAPELSAYRTKLSGPQMLVACSLGFLLLVGVLVDLQLTATVLVALATTFFVLSTGFRLYAAWAGARPGATIDPGAADLAAMDERSLPVYTVLLPVYKEKPATIGALFAALSRIDYPKHKLDGLLLIEDDDAQTRARRSSRSAGRRGCECCGCRRAFRARSRARWASGCATRRAAGRRSTTPRTSRTRPSSRRRCGRFQRADASVACLQAKLGYYNPRQNLLTRWFTLEYDAWFNILLPGLHPWAHRSRSVARRTTSGATRWSRCFGWDPYNVTEDADLGLRFARLGLQDGDARVDDRRGGEQPGRELDPAALALEQGLHADAAGPHPAPGSARARARGARDGRLPADDRRRGPDGAAGADLLGDAPALAVHAARVDRRVVSRAGVLRGLGQPRGRELPAGLPEPLRGRLPWARRPCAATRC